MEKADSTTMTLQQALDLAIQHHQAGRLREADTIYRKILEADPNNPHALHLTGLLASQVGQTDVAVEYIGRAIALNPTAAHYYSNLGAAHATAGRAQQALEAFDRAILLQPDLADAHENKGMTLLRLKHFDPAIESLQTALRARPNDFRILDHLGSALSQAGRQEEAVQMLRRALAIRSDYAPTHHNLGNALLRLNRTDEAIAEFRAALALRPDYPEVMCTLGGLLCQRGQVDEAISMTRRALNSQPNSTGLHFNLGRALHLQNRLQESADELRKVLALDPRFAMAYNELGNVMLDMKSRDAAIEIFTQSLQIEDSVEVRYNLATALFESGKFSEAIKEYEAAERRGFRDPRVYNNLGAIHRQLGHNAKAMEFFKKALSFGDDFVLARFNLAMMQLLTGDFENGWAGYETRWKARNLVQPTRYAQFGIWDGGDISGKRFLLDSEQGFGDSIQFARFIPILSARGAKTILVTHPELKRLLKTVPCLDEIISQPQELPHFDVQCPLMSLPYRLGTTLETIPVSIPYVFADPALVERWQMRLPRDGRKKIGLCWWGNVTHSDDQRRSFSLEAMAPLAEVPDAWFCSLQKGPAARQAAAPPPGLQIADWTSELSDFAETAALVANLDLVIACDTAVAHLAGAMGKPVWLILPHVADWRWMVKREDSPWYPTMRIFRQAKAGDWTGVFEEVAKALKKSARND
jgi:tetratricopeptide (TPR) repeat protein